MADNRNVSEPNVAQASARQCATQSAGRRFADLADFVKGSGQRVGVHRRACRSASSRAAATTRSCLYGGVGTGKTHLLEATYKRLRAGHPGLNVLFLSAEGFANYFTQALRDRTLPSFRQRFRSVDVLIVDDVDFLDGKRVIQEEFLHTMRQLESHDRQIVLSADRHPRLLTKLSEELVTRFIAGIVCRMESPDLETRRAIVARKAARLTTRVSDEALELVAQRFPHERARDSRGPSIASKRYGLMSRQAGQAFDGAGTSWPISSAIACAWFGWPTSSRPSAASSPSDPTSCDRRVAAVSVSQPRMLAMYLARKMTQAAYSEIGEYFGGRNHSTVMSAEKRVRELLTSQATLRIAAQTWKLGDLVGSLEQQLMTG